MGHRRKPPRAGYFAGFSPATIQAALPALRASIDQAEAETFLRTSPAHAEADEIFTLAA
jgi:hypothetical protein